MNCYIIDRFDMPHIEGIKATVVRVDAVTLDLDLFGKIEAKVFTGGSDEPSVVFPDVTISIEDPELRKKLDLEEWSRSYPTPDDIVFLCRYDGERIEWYRVIYEYTTQTNE